MPQNEVKMSVEQILGMFENEKKKLSGIESQLSGLYGAMNESNIVLSALEEMKSLKKQPVYFSLGAGIYAKAAIEDAENLLFTLPSGVVMNAGIADVKKKLDERKIAIQKDIDAFQKEAQLTTQTLNSLNSLVQQIARAQQQNAGKQ